MTPTLDMNEINTIIAMDTLSSPAITSTLTIESEVETTETKETIKPLCITDLEFISSRESLCKDEYGNKASNLFKLAKDGFPVPKTYVLECKHSISKPDNVEIEDDIRYSGIYWAVRSGAPKSMPGLLETKLNVHPSNIIHSVKTVWDSWHAPKAISFREETGISHTMGTAVIIQKMITPYCSGVAFTNNPINEANKEVFNPVVEYVMGTGDVLVGGEDSGFEANGSESWYKRLIPFLKKAHDLYGPSDIEFVIESTDYGNPGNIWIVQQRELKFIKAPTVMVDPNETRKLITILKPIGDGKRIWCKVSPAHQFKPKTAIHLDSFKPEYYDLMLSSKAIFTRIGGTTCHAAIVARELGLPALSGPVDLATLMAPDYGIIVNGSSGHVYEATEEDMKEALVAEENNPKPEIEKVKPKRPNFGISKTEWVGSKLLYRFYYVMDQYFNGKITLEEKNIRVEEIAHILSTYMYIITCGEMRHVKSKGWGETTKEIVEQLRLRNVKIPGDNGIGKPSRPAFFSEGGIPEPKSVDRTVEILEYVRMGFLDINWPSSFGGKRWANITSVVLDYFKGNTNATLFLDACFNLQHNNGTMFGKFTWMNFGLNILEMLNKKSSGFKSLKAYVKTCGYGSSYEKFASCDKILNLDKVAEDEQEHLLVAPAYWGGIKPINCEVDTEPEEDEEIDENAECDCELCTGLIYGKEKEE